MTIVLAVLGTVGVMLLVAGTSAILLRRSKARAERHVVAVVQDLTERMETMRRELATAVEETREEARRSRHLGELAGSIDLDEVLARTLDAAGAMPGVDAALVTVAQPGSEPIVVAHGIDDDELAEYSMLPPAQGRRLRMLSLTFDAGEEAEAAARAITAGLAVPIRGEVETLGLLTVFSRADPPAFEDSLRAELDQLTLRAGPAIENARRFREARQLADLDALTGLHNRRYFHETLAREVARAHRYGRRLALLVFDLDNFKAVNDRIGHLAGDSVLAELAERVREVVRTADIACRVGGDEFGVILPESTQLDGDQLYRRLQDAIGAKPPGASGNLTLSAGVAELRPPDDAVSLFERADEALYRAKGTGKARVAVESVGKELVSE